jgi:hypothetical protein
VTQKSLRGKGRQSRYLGLDRTIAGVTFLMVIFVCLLVAFSGVSMELSLPGVAGWIYIVCVIVAAAGVLVWLNRRTGKRKRSNMFGLKTIKAARNDARGPRNTHAQQPK